MSGYVRADVDVATKAEQRIDELRHAGVRLAIASMRDSSSLAALEVMLGTTESQARVAGIDVELRLTRERLR